MSPSPSERQRFLTTSAVWEEGGLLLTPAGNQSQIIESSRMCTLVPSEQSGLREAAEDIGNKQSIKTHVKVVEGDGNGPGLYLRGRSIVFHVQV